MTKNGWQILPNCGKEAERLDIIVACDGASSVGQIGHMVAVKLTKEIEAARMCCITAIAAGSKLHVDIAKKSPKLIVINGCPLKCASKVVKDKGIKPYYEITVSEEGIEKVPTLDFDEKDVERISNKIITKIKEKN